MGQFDVVGLRETTDPDGSDHRTVGHDRDAATPTHIARIAEVGEGEALPSRLLAAPTLVRYEDAVGDVEGGPGPDIVVVTVSQPDPASASIGVEFASEPPISFSVEDDPYWTDMLLVLIGTGPHGVIIGPDGVEAEFGAGLHGATLPHHLDEGVDPHREEDMLEGAVQVAVDGPTLTLTFTRESLGDPERMMFGIIAEREIGNAEEGGGQDIYPEDDGIGPLTHIAWTFQGE